MTFSKKSSSPVLFLLLFSSLTLPVSSPSDAVKTPLIIIPGIGGTELWHDHTFFLSDRYWPDSLLPTNSIDPKKLALNSDTPMRVGNVLRFGSDYVGPLGGMIDLYGNLGNFLIEQGYRGGESLPYNLPSLTETKASLLNPSHDLFYFA